MSSKGKKREEDEALSESEEPPKKTSRTENSSDDSDQILVCELSKNRRVSVRNWQGRVVVDIREFYVKDGKEFPGKKGSNSLRAVEHFIVVSMDFIDHGPVENTKRSCG